MTHPIPAAALKESVAVVGRTGSGKSYAAKGAIELLLTGGARVCIIDPTGVHWGLRSSADGKRSAFPIVVFGGDHGDVAIGDASGAALGELLATRNLPAIVDVSEFSRAGMVRFMGPFLDALYRHNKTPLTLVIDEADIFAPQRPEPDTAMMLGRMEQIVRRGRVKGFRPWMITQRPASLNKNVLSQANTLIAMQLTAPQDRDAIGAWIEGQADRDEGKKVLAALPKLQKGEGYVWSPSHNVLERVKFPAITTFDSGRTPEDGESLPPATLAAVDLSGIAESLQAVEAEARDNDPKALRKECADLRTKCADLERARAKPREDIMAVADAHRRGKIEGYGQAINALLPMTDRMETLRTALDEQIGGLLEDLAGWRRRFADAAVSIEKQTDAPQNANSRKADDKNSQKYSKLTELPERTKSPGRPAEIGDSSVGNTGLRRIMIALAQRPDMTNRQIAIRAGMSSNGGSFRTYMSRGRSEGWIVTDCGRSKMTAQGIKALGAYDPLPSGQALLEYWIGELGDSGAARILKAASDVYPDAIDYRALAAASGMSADGGSFRTYLSRLRTLELVEGRGEVRASEELFG